MDRKGPRLPPMAISDGRKEHGTGVQVPLSHHYNGVKIARKCSGNL